MFYAKREQADEPLDQLDQARALVEALPSSVGLEGAFARRSTIEIELHGIGDLHPVAVAGQ